MPAMGCGLLSHMPPSGPSPRAAPLVSLHPHQKSNVQALTLVITTVYQSLALGPDTKVAFSFFLLFNNCLFIFWLCCVFDATRPLLWLWQAGGYSVVAVHRLLITAASPVVEHGL